MAAHPPECWRQVGRQRRIGRRELFVQIDASAVLQLVGRLLLFAGLGRRYSIHFWSAAPVALRAANRRYWETNRVSSVQNGTPFAPQRTLRAILPIWPSAKSRRRSATARRTSGWLAAGSQMARIKTPPALIVLILPAAIKAIDAAATRCRRRSWHFY